MSVKLIENLINFIDKIELKDDKNDRQYSTPNTLIIGTGEYVTGYTGSSASKSDKSMGVVGLVCFDLRQRQLIGNKIGLCGTNGDKFDKIKEHFNETIKKTFYQTFSNNNSLSFINFPKKGKKNRNEYKNALNEFKKGDICIIFTPDDTHFDIVNAALDKGLHVMITKPIVKTLKEHLYLANKAKKNNLLLQIEVHKRYDAIYSDAVYRMKKLGSFNYFSSYMSQPKFQLETFKYWAGISSDISYYLNSHHIDLHVWLMQNKGKCINVKGISSNKVVAQNILNRNCEDTITIIAQWQNFDKNNSIGHAIYTASWTAIKADVHSQQRFFCLMENGEVNIDQAHRGYTIADEKNGFNSINPLFWRNVSDNEGNFVSQNCYGYISFEKFVRAATLINEGKRKASHFDMSLPTGNVTAMTTAILEGGRISLDNDGKKVDLIYDDNQQLVGLKLAE